MPKPTLDEMHKYYSAGAARAELGLSKEAFNLRMKQGILPAPTYINQHGLRFFDEAWLERARAILNARRTPVTSN